MFTSMLQHPTTPWGDIYEKFSKELKFTRHINTGGHEVHTRIDHILANNQMKELYTGCDINDAHNLDTDHNWILATLQINSNTQDTDYLKEDEGSNTRVYKDKNLADTTKENLINELNRNWPCIQTRLKPFNPQNIQHNYTEITTGLKESCNKILKKNSNTQSKHTHTPYSGNKDWGQLKKMKKSILYNRRRVIHALQNDIPLHSLKEVDTAYSVYITDKENLTIEITQTQWTTHTATNPQEWLTNTSNDLEKIAKIKNKLIKGMDQSTIALAIKKLNNSFKRGLKYFWSKITGNKDSHSLITSVEYTEPSTGKKVKSNNNNVVKKKFRKSWKKQYNKFTDNTNRGVNDC
jgi:hypothetical protein